MSDLISRQAAIDAVENIDCSDGVGISALKCEAVDDGVTAIKALPSAQPEERTEERTETHACDCISRQAAIDAHYEYCNKHPDAGFPVWSLKILEDLPSAQPDKDMIHLQKEQAYMQGWEEGRKALREEIWENERDRLD